MYTILDDTKKQCKMVYFEESTLDNKVNLGHYLNNLFQSFRIQYYKIYKYLMYAVVDFSEHEAPNFLVASA